MGVTVLDELNDLRTPEYLPNRREVGQNIGGYIPPCNRERYPGTNPRKYWWEFVGGTGEKTNAG